MTKPEVILLSGTLGDKHLWRYQLPGLEAHANVSVPDLTQHAHIGATAEDILHNAPRRFALAGFSMGGIIAQEILKHAPERVEKLALIDTSSGIPGNDKKERFRTWQSATQTTFDNLLNTFTSWVHANNTAVIPEIEEAARVLGVNVLQKQAGILLSQHNEPELLGRLNGPALILHGADDPVSSSADNALMAQHCTTPRLISLSRCGHYSILEKPQAVSVALQYWLQE